jgi:hypothetical protein
MYLVMAQDVILELSNQYSVVEVQEKHNPKLPNQLKEMVEHNLFEEEKEILNFLSLLQFFLTS